MMQHKTFRRDRLEGLLWMLFSAGGMLTAFVLPVHILLNNVAPGLGLLSPRAISYDSLSGTLGTVLFGIPIFKLYFLAVIAGAVYHGMHRIRFILYEMGFKNQHLGVMVFEHLIDAAIILPAAFYLLLA